MLKLVRSPVRAALILGFVMLGWIWGGSSALAHDPNLSRWDISHDGDTVRVTVRLSGAGIYSELSKREPDVAWDELSPAQYRRRVEAFMAKAFEFREGDRRLPVKVDNLRLGHETSATLRLKRRTDAPLQAFTLDLSRVSSRSNQHHLVFVRHRDRRERFMLHRSESLVLRWTAHSETSNPQG